MVWLCGDTEFFAFKESPEFAYGFDDYGFSFGVSLDHGFGEFCFVVNHERNEDEFVVDEVADFIVCPNSTFKFATVCTSESGEVEEYGFVFLYAKSHAFFEVVGTGVNFAFKEREVLGVAWGCESGDCFEGSSPQAGYHVYCEGDADESHHESSYTCFFDFGVVGEA